jgi:hypothetical protein
MDEFEQELMQALERRPAPPGLKARVMAQRNVRRIESRRTHSVLWLRLAASLVIVALLACGVDWRWRRVEEQRKGELARQQVLTALRITGHALNKVQARLAAHDRATGE